MAARPLIIDCDPGVDDAVALFLAFAAPDALDILGITTVAGNVDALLTARNARIIREMAERDDVPVYAGAPAPLVRPPIIADHFHGETGLGTLPVFEPRAGLAAGSAARAIVDLVMARAAGDVAIAVTGPFTNLALALKLEPALAAHLGPVVVMGGARSEGGNITASAEYNVYADPHAAQIVFASGCDVITLGLDATHQVRATPDRMEVLSGIKTRGGAAVFDLLTFGAEVELKHAGQIGSPLHDPCTIAYLLAPHLFTTVPAIIRVETESELTLGHTQVEFRGADGSRTLWTTHADADGVFAMLYERLAR